MDVETATELHLVLPLKVPFNQVISASRHFLRLSQSVAGEVLRDDEGERVTWVLDDFASGSLDLVMKPEIDGEQRESAATIVHAIATGVLHIERESTRPPYFSDAALHHAKNLARLEGVAIRNGRVGTPLTDALRRNVDRIIGTEQAEWGTIEGRIESLTVHRRRIFNLYEPISGNRIECHFGHRIPTEQIGLAVEKRVAVSGRIVYVGSEVVRVDAEELDVFPPIEDLPSASDVYGILADGAPHGGL